MAHSDYTTCIRNLPRPADAQVDAFVDYLAPAHSWYKHLPLLPPGTQFVFYLNPNAGREWVWTWRGGHYRDRTDATPHEERFHYTWQPTRQYIQRFGYLDYYAAAGTAFLINTPRGVLDTQRSPRIQSPAGKWIDLPADLRIHATVPVTGVIHVNGQEPFFWLLQWSTVRSSVYETLPSPRGSNDDIVATVISLLQRIPDVAASSRELRKEVLDLPVCTELKNKWLPAYASQQRQRVRETIHHMLEWVYDEPTTGTSSCR